MCARTQGASPVCLAGQGDVANNVPVEELSRFDNHPRIRAEKVEGVRMYFLAMNVTHKPFDNKLVRQAINYAVDPVVIIKHIYEGNGYIMNGPMGSNVIGFDPKIKRYPLDLNKAKELLTKAGYPNGVDVKLYFSPDRYPKAKEVCQVIADQLSKVGIKVELVSQEFVIFWGKEGVNGGKLGFLLRRPAGGGRRYGLRSVLSLRREPAHSIQESGVRQAGRRRAENRRCEKAPRACCIRLGRILMEDVPFCPLYTLAEIYGVARNINWKARPDEKLMYAEMKIR